MRFLTDFEENARKTGGKEEKLRSRFSYAQLYSP